MIATIAGVLAPVAVVGTAAGHPVAVVPLLAALGFAFYFFRDPVRVAPADDQGVVSPADGRILAVVEEREEHFLQAPARRISIFMSPLDVHVNRNPVSGRVTTVRHTPGKFRAAFADKASEDNERNAVVVDDGRRRYLMVQVAGAIARRIVCDVAPGDRVERGARMGMIMFGSRVDLWVPTDARPTVKVGDRVQAGLTVVAELPR